MGGGEMVLKKFTQGRATSFYNDWPISEGSLTKCAGWAQHWSCFKSGICFFLNI